MIISVSISVSLTMLASLFLPLACTQIPDTSPLREVQPVKGKYMPASPEKLIGESSQILLVRNMNPVSIDVCVIALEKRNGLWQSPFPPMDGVIGRNGFAPPGEKREGDGRTPSGIFTLGMVFGYDPSFPTRMPYRQAADDDLWIDDVHADDYNRWVKRGATKASSFERMKRDDNLYKYGIVVEYNMNPIIKAHGSAIFFHLWRGNGKPTEGCVALSEEDLVIILRWLDPASRPMVVMGTGVTISGY
jgi:L,D-peptidoglycan transpeptidase YkuD (ErfK/YbiS/YcfS/YnhG family)